MNNNWWQEFVRFFLRGITLKQLIVMFILLIILIIVTPVSLKEWVNQHNPEIIPPYWMYYTLLFCISFIISGFIPGIINTFSKISARYSARQKKAKNIKLLDFLDSDERELLEIMLEMGNIFVCVPAADVAAVKLAAKGVLVRTGNMPVMKQGIPVPVGYRIRYHLTQEFRLPVLEKFRQSSPRC